MATRPRSRISTRAWRPAKATGSIAERESEGQGSRPVGRVPLLCRQDRFGAQGEAEAACAERDEPAFRIVEADAPAPVGTVQADPLVRHAFALDAVDRERVQ